MVHESSEIFGFVDGQTTSREVCRTPYLKCALCLDFYSAPVRMTNCGHNFCSECLIGMVQAEDMDAEEDENEEFIWNCPECRTEQSEKPQRLARNFFVERTVKRFKDEQKNQCATHKATKKLRKYFNLSNRNRNSG